MRFRLVEEKEFHSSYQNKEQHKNDKRIASCEGCPKYKYAVSSEKNNSVRSKIK